MVQFFQNVKFDRQHMGWLLDIFLPFFLLQTLLDLQIFKFSLFFDLVLKLLKSNSLIFPASLNLIINSIILYLIHFHLSRFLGTIYFHLSLILMPQPKSQVN
jgi:hypothetical protein